MRSPIGAGSLRTWCERHLGSPPAEELFATGNLAKVYGLRLGDGREVVVKVRPAEERLTGCAAVQRHLWQAGFPCPEPLAGPLPLSPPSPHPDQSSPQLPVPAVSAEALLTGGRPFPASAGPERAQAFAALLARFIAVAPHPSQVPDLDPPPAWIHWDHGLPGLWPPPDDRDADLNDQPGSAWLDAFGHAARAVLLPARAAPRVIGHCDWESHNLDFRDGEPWAVHDWDSVVSAPEPVIVGVAAAMWPADVGCHGATVVQSEQFLEAYQGSRGVPFRADELAQTWAAGLWIRAFNAKKWLLDGRESLSADEAEERLRRAGGSLKAATGL
ncbi:MAG: phosphotransferase [Catenulispora sp.]|nr:phosphotransferase [Catenulispora sp.]